MQYRRDIDGLRAISILLVLAYHAGIAPFSGGFIGVDVFFVISGFLITGLILRERQAETFTYSAFYLRRFRRLLPAFLVVTLVTTIAAWAVMVPEDLRYYSASLAASWLGVSNFFFATLSGNYFSPRMESFPLLHTWSLGVEEQFYVIWPALLILVGGYLRKGFAPLLIVLASVLIVSSEFVARSSPSLAYYHLPFRAFEMIFGALLAMKVGKWPVPSPLMGSVVSSVSLLIILYMAVTLTGESIFPGINAAIVAAASVGVIYGNSSPQSCVSRVLSMPVFVGIGLLSYSLYLWHWPIFSMLRYRQVELIGLALILSIAASLILSWATWILVEIPYRKKVGLSFRKALVGFLVMPAAIAATFFVLVMSLDGVPQRFSPELRTLMASYSSDRDFSRKCSIRDSDSVNIRPDVLEEHCSFGAESTKVSVLLLGDSHANHMRPFLDVALKDASRRAVYHVQGNCLAVRGISTPHEENSCALRNRALLDISDDIDYVVLASAWASYPIEEVREGLRTAVTQLLEAGATPVIFKDTPSPGRDMSKCVLYNALGWKQENCEYPVSDVRSREDMYDSAIDEVALNQNKVVVVDPKSGLCGSESCVTSLKGIAVYRDSNHLNDGAARLLGELFLMDAPNFMATGNR